MSDPRDKANSTRPTQGDALPTDTADQIAAAIETVFDYRGDVTIHTADGAKYEGYVFDRRRDGQNPALRLMPRKGGSNVTIRYADVTRVLVTGRDTASGKSFETWLKKYNEAKAKGESADWPIEDLSEESGGKKAEGGGQKAEG